MDDAYESGLKPNEFFELTPGEVIRWIRPAWREKINTAWMHESVHRLKRLPSNPKELWPEKQRAMTPAQMFRHLRSTMQERNKK